MLSNPDYTLVPMPRRRFRRVSRTRILEGVSLWLAVLMLLAVQPLYAEASETGNAGTLEFLDRDGRPPAPATLLRTDYDVSVAGIIADTTLVQAFRNTSNDWREGVYRFPLPEDASVYHLRMTAGDRVIEGEIRTRKQATREYKQARAAGQQAARVDQERPNLFSTHLANIPPGETVTVELKYQHRVRYQSGHFQLRLPTTVTPRYMPGPPLSSDSERQWQGGWATPTGAVPDAHRISPMTVRPADLGRDSHRARVALTLNAGLPIAAVTSASHKLSTHREGDTVTVAPADGDLVMNRDLVVTWSPERGQAPSAAVFHEHWQGEDFLLTLLVPGLDAGTRLPRELIFVIDTSGSVGGEAIRQARAALLQGLDTLTGEDRFNVIQFNSRTQTLFADARPATDGNLARARRYVGGLEAGGGTEMAPALTAALADAADREEGGVRQVVFITDGAVGNEAALFRRIKTELGQSRLFTVAIGSAPNMHFMRQAARHGRGTYTGIHDPAGMEQPLAELFRKMQAPVLTDLTSQWPDQAGRARALPERPGDLFQGEPLVQVVRGQAPEGKVRVSGRLPEHGRWQRSLALDQAAPATGLHRYWARQRINALMDEGLSGRVSEQQQQVITGLALRHRLTTRYTSFVAVDRTPRRPRDQALETEAMATLLPAGSNAGMLRYPATATWSALLVNLGLTGLLACLGLLWWRRASA